MIYYSPSIFNAYNICKRQAWLMQHQISTDQYNEFIMLGRLIDETSFKQEKKRIYLPGTNAQIDAIIKRNGIFTILEIKKSSKTLKSGIAQLKYYLYLLKHKKNIEVKGIIKIPTEKTSKEVVLTKDDELKIESTLKEMGKILNKPLPPKPNKIMRLCYKCGYYEFCWS